MNSNNQNILLENRILNEEEIKRVKSFCMKVTDCFDLIIKISYINFILFVIAFGIDTLSGIFLAFLAIMTRSFYVLDFGRFYIYVLGYEETGLKYTSVVYDYLSKWNGAKEALESFLKSNSSNVEKYLNMVKEKLKLVLFKIFSLLVITIVCNFLFSRILSFVIFFVYFYMKVFNISLPVFDCSRLFRYISFFEETTYLYKTERKIFFDVVNFIYQKVKKGQTLSKILWNYTKFKSALHNGFEESSVLNIVGNSAAIVVNDSGNIISELIDNVQPINDFVSIKDDVKNCYSTVVNICRSDSTNLKKICCSVYSILDFTIKNKFLRDQVIPRTNIESVLSITKNIIEKCAGTEVYLDSIKDVIQDDILCKKDKAEIIVMETLKEGVSLSNLAFSTYIDLNISSITVIPIKTTNNIARSFGDAIKTGFKKLTENLIAGKIKKHIKSVKDRSISAQIRNLDMGSFYIDSNGIARTTN